VGQGPAIRGSWFSPDGDRQFKTADFDRAGHVAQTSSQDISGELRDVPGSNAIDRSRRFAALCWATTSEVGGKKRCSVRVKIAHQLFPGGMTGVRPIAGVRRFSKTLLERVRTPGHAECCQQPSRPRHLINWTATFRLIAARNVAAGCSSAIGAHGSATC